MFIGESTHTLDAKNRVFIPKRIQEKLDRDENGNLTVYVTRGFDACVFLFSVSGWESMYREVTTKPFVDPERRSMQRAFMSSSFSAQLDSSGRLLLPEKLKRVAGLEREVSVIGVGERAEIWNREVWERQQAEINGKYDDMYSLLVSPEDVQHGGENGSPHGSHSGSQ